ncbi:flavodoxin family protein [Campylobacter sp. RM12651]|uniref:flavodoxin family protein n=1 Tax=Campylobacter sp. RM12651 TaxID=1660079 RepID=UPI001EFA53C0|nr:flavodoxin family protein [Campylobacter sp. RM12651]ULO04198.1 heme oxygenase, HugZ family (flavodoxin domain) [Campylobacter sp. RM12651]
MVVLYLSKNNSSKKIALEIAKLLNIDCFNLEHYKGIDKHRYIFLVFWLEKGNITSNMPKIQNKILGIIFTCGADKNSEYIKNKKEMFFNIFNKNNQVLGIQAVNGAISDEYINNAKKLAKENPNYIITKEKEKLWKNSKKHPDENDLKITKNFTIYIKEKIMKLQQAKEHMNKDHKDSLFRLVKHHTNKDAQNVELIDITYSGMDILYDGEILHLDYKTKASEDTLHYSVIELVSETKINSNNLDEEIKNFKHSFKSVNIASVSKNNQVICSYAPIIFKNDEMFIFISEVAEHFSSIKNNSNNIEIMFLEDESKAKTIFARKRLKYQVNAKIVDDRREELFEVLKEKYGNEVNIFSKMLDFHFIQLSIKSGRFVKGFGAAFDIDSNNKAAEVRLNMPHKLHNNAN